jgi:hypothetical protein
VSLYGAGYDRGGLGGGQEERGKKMHGWGEDVPSPLEVRLCQVPLVVG